MSTGRAVRLYLEGPLWPSIIDKDEGSIRKKENQMVTFALSGEICPLFPTLSDKIRLLSFTLSAHGKLLTRILGSLRSSIVWAIN